MAGDAIFGEESEDDEVVGVTLTPEQAQALDAERADSKASIADLTAKLEDMSKMLANPPTPMPTPTAPVDPNNMTADESLTLLAKDPTKFTQLVADGQINKAIAQQLAPILNPLLATSHQSVVESLRQAHDITYGVGSFDKIVMPELQVDLDGLAQQNSSAMGDANTVRALVQRIEGTKRTELNEAEAGAAKLREDATKAETARVVSFLPASMQPKPEGGAKELTEEAKEMFSDIERATGERPDEGAYLATQNAAPGVTGHVAAMTDLAKSREERTT